MWWKLRNGVAGRLAATGIGTGSTVAGNRPTRFAMPNVSGLLGYFRYFGGVRGQAEGRTVAGVKGAGRGTASA